MYRTLLPPGTSFKVSVIGITASSSAFFPILACVRRIPDCRASVQHRVLLRRIPETTNGTSRAATPLPFLLSASFVRPWAVD
jgi:hypothetical protein